MHWADQLADKIIERAHREKRVATIKCQQTPSGGKHIGNLNEVMRAYFPYKAVIERQEKCSFVHMSDDRDPLKDIPAKLADLQANWHDSAKFSELKKFLGKPLFRVPDPFQCCESYAKHFTQVWMNGVHALGINPDLHYTGDVYNQGKFDPYIKMVFEKREQVGKIVSDLQATKDTSYVPFDAICPQCGVLANIDDFDVKNKKVHFVCGGKSIKKKKAEGCSYEGWVSWREGKLQWRFEWPALMAIFNTTFEPFGKDHAEGSWKSVLRIMPEIFNKEPPIPFVYEFFLVNGEKMSASKGNVYIVQDMLKIMEPEVFRFYYVKRPEKQRDLELGNIFQLVDEFDECERIYFGDQGRSENREENARRMYELAMPKTPDKKPNRVGFAFCAALAQLLEDEQAVEKLKELGHVATTEDERLVRMRLPLARNWVELYGEEHRLSIASEAEAKQRRKKLLKNAAAALSAYAGEFPKTEAQHVELVKKICAEHSLAPKQFFESAYLIILGKTRGPKLFTLLSVLGKEKSKRLLA